jgi:ABC-2 type transport system permease protein
MGSIRQRARKAFRKSSAASALRRKEWTLLMRDPWLASQTLMQVLYLIPPALLLWRNYGTQHDGLVILTPVLVMASGQLAGGLAWLAISGEDAPDLVSTSPVRWSAILRAKCEAVIGSIGLLLAPIVLVIATLSPWVALVTIGAVFAAAASSTTIQLFFRAQARRSHFRRRQTSSRIATLAEAFSSIGWAATAAFAAAGSRVAIVTAVVPVVVLVLAALFRPRQALA